jgi:hypothetical protein
MAARKRKMTHWMPILRHDNNVTPTMKLFGKAVYGNNYLIPSLDPEGTRWHEIVLHVNDDERIRLLYPDTSDQIEFLKPH